MSDEIMTDTAEDIARAVIGASGGYDTRLKFATKKIGRYVKPYVQLAVDLANQIDWMTLPPELATRVLFYLRADEQRGGFALQEQFAEIEDIEAKFKAAQATITDLRAALELIRERDRCTRKRMNVHQPEVMQIDVIDGPLGSIARDALERT